jgi:hypothetical protein
MADGQMEGIHIFFVLFQDSLTMNYTTSRLGLPIRGIRNYKKRLGYTKGAIAAFSQQKLQALFYPTRK